MIFSRKWLKNVLTTPIGARSAEKSIARAADSLELIARALTVIVQREYSIDLDAPPLSKREQRAEVFEPMYADDEREAIREHVEALREAEMDDGSAGGGVRLQSATSRGEDELTPAERAFLAELESDSSGKE